MKMSHRSAFHERHTSPFGHVRVGRSHRPLPPQHHHATAAPVCAPGGPEEDNDSPYDEELNDQFFVEEAAARELSRRHQLGRAPLHKLPPSRDQSKLNKDSLSERLGLAQIFYQRANAMRHEFGHQRDLHQDVPTSGYRLRTLRQRWHPNSLSYRRRASA